MRPGRRRAAVLALTACATTLAACGGSGKSPGNAAPATTRTASLGTVTMTVGATRTTRTAGSSAPGTQRLTVHLSAPQSEPKAGGLWPITVTASAAGGGPVNGVVSYAYLFAGTVVARRPGGRMHDGVFHDRMEFPARAVGYPLTVEVIVHGEAGTRGSVTRPVMVER